MNAFAERFCHGGAGVEVPLTASHYQVKRGDFATVRELASR